MQRSPLVPAVAVAVLLVASGCTPLVMPPSPSSSVSSPPSDSPTPTLSPSPSPSPSPAQTLDEHQVAAIEAVDTYEAVTAEIGANPSGFTKVEMTAMFETAVGENMVKGNVDFFLAMAEQGYREVGTRQAVSIVSSEAQDNGRGTELWEGLAETFRQGHRTTTPGRSSGKRPARPISEQPGNSHRAPGTRMA